MKLFTKTLAAASLAGAAIAATPAAAQVSGNIGVVDVSRTVVASSALSTGFQQIGTTYASQITQIQQKQQQAQTLIQQLDTNNDGNLDQAEQQAAQTAPQAQQIQTLEREIAQLQNQLDTARVYVVEQILLQYGAALQTVVAADNIQLVISPDAVAWSNPAANIGQKVVNALNARVPSVQITPPQGWQPSQQSVAVYQQVQQLMVMAARQQAAAQQQQQPAQTNGR
ncbi:OmpH family outer membrane protein [Qipengyuania sphaerica]|uniref:OmpH family outer membrane protein n=1 Tax=Qipengyuania sphaerica TaxID=2867243 RepID=UPI001C89FD98|nr:OmpH family outer membrane protein [Qipengyuania sphaerica]MBX7541957.1 OmpH family outer membrane protein [Qipengyuania sphaerica]